MDIQAPLNGWVTVSRESVPEGADGEPGPPRERLRIRLPISFCSVTVTRQALVDCRVVSAKVFATDEQLGLASVVAIRSYSADSRGKVIEDRPVSFRPTEPDDTNTLTFEFLLRRVSGEPLEELDGRDIALRLELVFSSLQRVQFLADVEPNLAAGSLRVRKFAREKPAGPVLRNLLVLLMVVGGLSAWNFFLNRDVFDQPSVLARNLVSVGIGAALTFFGLSISRIKNWFRAMSNLAGLIRFPELHLDSTVARTLETRGASAALVVLGIAVMFLTVWNWPIALEQPADSRIAIYDTVSGRRVTATKVYSRDVRSDRFVVACVNGPYSPDRPPLGRLRAGLLRAEPEPLRFDVTFPALLAPDITDRGDFGMYTHRANGFQLLDLRLERGREELHRALCDGRSNFVTFEAPGSRDGDAGGELKIVLQDFVEEDELLAKLNLFRHDRLKKHRSMDLWASRHEMADAVAQHLLEEIGEQQIEAATFLAATTEVVNSVKGARPDRKQTIERTILVRGLVRAYHERLADSPDRPVVQGFTQVVRDRFGTVRWSEVDRRVFLAWWELMLDVERYFPDASEGLIHEAIWTPSDDRRHWLAEQGAEPVLYYLGLCLADGSPDLLARDDRRDAFTAVLPRLRNKLGDLDRVVDRTVNLRRKLDVESGFSPEMASDRQDRGRQQLLQYLTPMAAASTADSPGTSG